ncbi:MAG: tRNA pseudouridine(55) synthase TruB [Hyphomicrobiales bacterium]|nr:tRNA pseudouridine(55) synthase TruB [Hyphomicrobiales bacterium]
MARRKKGDPVHGWVILDKRREMTSTQAVGAVRRLFNARKAGHGGTLDPLATGLLPIALGEATKTVPFVMDGEKTYRFTVEWGCETTTDDAEGESAASSDDRPDEQAIRSILPQFTGLISQVPPKFSALKIDGARAYDLARDGEDVELAAREVLIDTLDLVDMPDADHAAFEAVCGKGTYVRSIARDMGRELGCYGHVSDLRRTQVGPFNEDDMILLDQLDELRHKGAGQEAMQEYLLPLVTALDDIPALAVSGEDAARLRNGQAVIVRGRDAPILQGTILVENRGSPVALAEMEQGALQPKRVFNLT